MSHAITVHTQRKVPGAEVVRDGLLAFNAAQHGGPQALPLVLLHRDAAGSVQAGLVGEVYLSWLYVERLWVTEALRGQGIGGALLEAAEREGRARGAIGAHLVSSTFQAPEFYRKRGYAEVGRLRDRPPGHDRMWFAKRLDGVAG